ncbi:MAG: RNA polymerase sigma factor [Candidatus Paceibacterota bacterium]|jgi:RNA polymerase sigma-70 factor (ECF subfamily)
MEKTDQELVSEYFKGDANALDTLVTRHLKSIYNFAWRQTGNAEEANDIAQEVFVKAWKNLKRYDPNQNFKTWIMAIARNTSIDWLRKRRALSFSDLDNKYTEETFEETLVDKEPLPDEAFERGEAKGVVDELMKELTEVQRSAITLRVTEDLPFEEIAAIMKKPVNTVKSYYRRGLLAMRKKLLKNDGSAPN